MSRHQVYELRVEGRHHRVETSVGDGWSNSATWWIDGEEIASTKAAEDTLHLTPAKEHPLAETAGAVRVRFTVLSKPVRATWFEGARGRATTAAYVGTGGIDLVPEPGSPAARREERMRAHPRLHATRHVVGGVGKVVVPILAALLAAWLLARISLPDWDIPWPDLKLPTIPWPSVDLPRWNIDWQPPGWLRRVLEVLKYVWPILLGLWLARRELRRRREQDELRDRLATEGGSGRDTGGSAVRDVTAGEAEDTESGEDETPDPGDERADHVHVLRGDVADQAEGGPLDEPRGQVQPGAHVREHGGHGEDRPDRDLRPG